MCIYEINQQVFKNRLLCNGYLEHGMDFPQDTDGWWLILYSEKADGHLYRGGPPAWGLIGV